MFWGPRGSDAALRIWTHSIQGCRGTLSDSYAVSAFIFWMGNFPERKLPECWRRGWICGSWESSWHAAHGKGELMLLLLLNEQQWPFWDCEKLHLLTVQWSAGRAALLLNHRQEGCKLFFPPGTYQHVLSLAGGNLGAITACSVCLAFVFRADLCYWFVSYLWTEFQGAGNELRVEDPAFFRWCGSDGINKKWPPACIEAVFSWVWGRWKLASPRLRPWLLAGKGWSAHSGSGWGAASSGEI